MRGGLPESSDLDEYNHTNVDNNHESSDLEHHNRTNVDNNHESSDLEHHNHPNVDDNYDHLKLQHGLPGEGRPDRALSGRSAGRAVSHHRRRSPVVDGQPVG